MGVGKALDESDELPFQSKSLEQQHWYVTMHSAYADQQAGDDRLEASLWYVSFIFRPIDLY